MNGSEVFPQGIKLGPKLFIVFIVDPFNIINVDGTIGTSRGWSLDIVFTFFPFRKIPLGSSSKPHIVQIDYRGIAVILLIVILEVTVLRRRHVGFHLDLLLRPVEIL